MVEYIFEGKVVVDVTTKYLKKVIYWCVNSIGQQELFDVDNNNLKTFIFLCCFNIKIYYWALFIDI